MNRERPQRTAAYRTPAEFPLRLLRTENSPTEWRKIYRRPSGRREGEGRLRRDGANLFDRLRSIHIRAHNFVVQSAVNHTGISNSSSFGAVSLDFPAIS